MEHYLHIQAKELLKELGSIPPESGLSVKFDDEAIQHAIRAKHVRELITRLQQTATDVDMNSLLREERNDGRKKEVAR